MASKSNEAWAEELATVTACVLAAADITIDSEITTPDARFAKYIDHTLLKPDATPAQIDKLCDEALKYKFKASKHRLARGPDGCYTTWISMIIREL